MLTKSSSWWPRSFPFLLSALALLGSSCVWGVVRDAETGAPLRGVQVTYTDRYGQTLSTTTDVNGIYAFDQAQQMTPARGQATLSVDAAGYDAYSETRLIEYNDNPNATLANMSTFWEAQGAALIPPPNRYHNEMGGFSLTFPSQWDIVNEVDYPVVMGFAPYTDPAGAACLAMSMESIPDINPDWVANALLKEMRGDCVEYRENLRGSGELDMMPATRVVFSCELESEGSGRTLPTKHVMYIASRGTNLYVMMCLSAVTAFPGRELVFNEVAGSFRTD